MHNYEVDSIYFCPCLMKAVEIIVRDPRIKLSGLMFESVYLNYSGQTVLVKTFPATQNIGFFCYKHVIDVFIADPNICCHYFK